MSNIQLNYFINELLFSGLFYWLGCCLVGHILAGWLVGLVPLFFDWLLGWSFGFGWVMRFVGWLSWVSLVGCSKRFWLLIFRFLLLVFGWLVLVYSLVRCLTAWLIVFVSFFIFWSVDCVQFDNSNWLLTNIETCRLLPHHHATAAAAPRPRKTNKQTPKPTKRESNWTQLTIKNWKTSSQTNKQPKQAWLVFLCSNDKTINKVLYYLLDVILHAFQLSQTTLHH